MVLRATLVTDGTSDAALVPILEWLMKRRTPTDFEITGADPGSFRRGSRRLTERLTVAIDRYPCRLLFVHRDAEKQDPSLSSLGLRPPPAQRPSQRRG